MNFSKVNYGKNSGLKQDTEDFEKQSEAPLKYYTTNWNTVLPQDAGINFNDGFRANAVYADTESQLIRSTITNPRVRQNFGFLPMATTGGLATSGPVIGEENDRSRKSCQPISSEHYKRHFYELKNYKNMTDENRKGLDTRQDGRSSLGGKQ